MFDFAHPPFLVFSIDDQNIKIFPEKEGYIHHPFTDGKTLVSYGGGWTFPVPVKKKAILTEPPMILVKNTGGVTSESSRARSGYAHQFVNEDGSDPECIYKCSVFQEIPDEWMFIADTVSAVWLQFTSQNQYLGDTGADMLTYQYGKMIITKLTVVRDIAPRMDRKADIPEMHDMQYRVSDRPVFSINWNMTDRNTSQYLSEELSSRTLDRYQKAVEISLLRAGFRN